MPSVSVPLKDAKGWDVLQRQRRTFWAKGTNNTISQHFKASEFYCHDGSAPPIVARPAMIDLARVTLEPMRERFGTCYILSGYRHELYNQAIGGVVNSQHIYEHDFESVATDVRFEKGTPAQWAAYARGLRTQQGGRGGVGRYDTQGFVHVDNRSYKADWSG